MTIPFWKEKFIEEISEAVKKKRELKNITDLNIANQLTLIVFFFFCEKNPDEKVLCHMSEFHSKERKKKKNDNNLIKIITRWLICFEIIVF